MYIYIYMGDVLMEIQILLDKKTKYIFIKDNKFIIWL
jgi:hypothetical protein